MNNTATIEIDFSKYSKKDLLAVIMYAHRNNYTFEQAVVEALKSFIQDNSLIDKIEENKGQKFFDFYVNQR